jgi:hypothetical protein
MLRAAVNKGGDLTVGVKVPHTFEDKPRIALLPTVDPTWLP